MNRYSEENHIDSQKSPFNKFAIVKLWPELKTAEDECIARIKLAAEMIGVDCLEVDAEGYFLEDPTKRVSRKNIDFVIHLHYDTPKNYDAFSFAALWNPLRFYHEWGYYRCTRNLLTHDDFLSCGSDVADSHVGRLIRNEVTHLPPKFSLFHSLPKIINKPSLGDGKLFYVGINWEAAGGGKSRHQEVLKRLDRTGFLRIYGPEIFNGVRVWSGYDSYIGEIPFDGVSMIEEISKAGIALVLSSAAHKESSLMSSRLFEALAAGALVICDENPFAKKFFGDTLLYINSEDSPEKISDDIKGHLNWAKNNPNDALCLIQGAQKIFNEKFTLVEGLSKIYVGLEARKAEILRSANQSNDLDIKVALNLLVPTYDKDVLQRQLKNIEDQDYLHINPRLFIGSEDYEKNQKEIESILINAGVRAEISKIEFNKTSRGKICKRPTGEIIHEILNITSDFEFIIIVAPNEQLFSNHVSTLVGALQSKPLARCAATSAIIKREGIPIHGIHEVIDFESPDANYPIGYGRFMFRTSTLPDDLKLALPFLDEISLAVLVGAEGIVQLLPASITIFASKRYPEIPGNIIFEREVVRDYLQVNFNPMVGFNNNYRVVSATSSYNPLTLLNLMKLVFNLRWVRVQIRLIRKQGLSPRLRLLKMKLCGCA